MLQRLQSESVQINTSKYISLHQLSRLWVYIEFKLWRKKMFKRYIQMIQHENRG
jgi:hypothetical protein